jgi:hypothetical protein
MAGQLMRQLASDGRRRVLVVVVVVVMTNLEIEKLQGQLLVSSS